MFKKVFNQITDTLEAIDNQAAASVANTQGQFMSTEESLASELVLRSNDYESMNAELQRSQAQNQSLEHQLSRLQKQCSHLETENSELEMKNAQISEDLKAKTGELSRIKATYKSLEQKHAQEFAHFEDLRISFIETREKLQKEVSALSTQLLSTQHELHMKNNELSKLTSDLSSKEIELASLEAEIGKYREKAVSSLSVSEMGPSVTGQLELLENERNRLKERLSRYQQQIAQLEVVSKELEEQMQNEISQAKMQQSRIETELFRSKTQNDALVHEIELLKTQLITAGDAAEAKYKTQLAQERIEHRAEIARVKEQFSVTARSSQSTEEQLLQALAQIDSLKSDKAALLVMLESGKNASDRNRAFSLGVEKRKPKTIPLASLVQKLRAPWLFQAVTKIDILCARGSDFLASKPLIRLILIIWCMLVTFLWILRI